jgi:hypothetical protein
VAGLFLRGAEIKGDLDLVGMEIGANTVVDLRDASCGVLIDAIECWPSAGNLVLDGFTYRRLRDPLTEARLDWLRRQLPVDKKARLGQFRPQPYRQLAGVFREQGLEAEGKAVLIGLAEDRRKWAAFGHFWKMWQLVLWITIRNGYQPMRAFYGLLLLWLIGFLTFGWGYQSGVMVPSERFAYEEYAKGTLRDNMILSARWSTLSTHLYQSLVSARRTVGIRGSCLPDPRPCNRRALVDSTAFSAKQVLHAIGTPILNG